MSSIPHLSMQTLQSNRGADLRTRSDDSSDDSWDTGWSVTIGIISSPLAVILILAILWFIRDFIKGLVYCWWSICKELAR